MARWRIRTFVNLPGPFVAMRSAQHRGRRHIHSRDVRWPKATGSGLQSVIGLLAIVLLGASAVCRVRKIHHGAAYGRAKKKAWITVGVIAGIALIIVLL